MIIHSIKWRLQAWHGFLLVLLVTGLLMGFYGFEQRAQLQAIDNDLQEAITTLLPRLMPPANRGAGERGWRPQPPDQRAPPDRRPPEEGMPENRGRDLDALLAEKFYFVMWSPQGDALARSTNAPQGSMRMNFARAVDGRGFRTRGTLRELTHQNRSGAQILIGTSLAALQAERRQLAGTLVLLGGTIVLVGFAVGWWLATRALRPIAAISQTAREIAAGDLSKRINVSETESELGQLATVLNSTFARLEAAFAQQQQFTSDAAHELRTPVSVILTQVQSTLNKERSGAEYRETLEACQRAAQRMRRLMESLLELARFDAGQESLQRSAFDLGAVARESAELVGPLAAEKQVRLSADAPPTQCLGDPQRIGQVLTNLLTNAVTYNQPGGEVRLSVSVGSGGVVVTVADNGLGISAADAAHVFKRFYRADKARAGTAGNAGLGLAICKSIIEVHGGTIDFTSESGRGTEFIVRLPAA